MPAMEMGQESALVVRWLKSEGDPVRKGEPLIEIETDKVTVEIEAPATGTLAGVAAAEGDDVAVGTTIALIVAAGEAAGGPPALRRQRVLASPKARRLAAEAGVDLASFSADGGRPLRSSDIASAAAAAPPEDGPLPCRPARRGPQARRRTAHRELPGGAAHLAPAQRRRDAPARLDRGAEGGRAPGHDACAGSHSPARSRSGRIRS